MPNFLNIQNSIRETVLRLPVILGNAAVNWTIDSFEKQAWRGYTMQLWKVRSPKAKRNAGRALLILTGRGRRSIRVLRLDANSVVFGTDLAYMEAHNKGFKGQVNVRGFTRNSYGKAKAQSIKTHRTKTLTYISGTSTVKPFTRNMNLPRRQFMPDDESLSPIFQHDMEQVIKQELEPFFK